MQHAIVTIKNKQVININNNQEYWLSARAGSQQLHVIGNKPDLTPSKIKNVYVKGHQVNILNYRNEVTHFKTKRLVAHAVQSAQGIFIQYQSGQVHLVRYNQPN